MRGDSYSKIINKGFMTKKILFTGYYGFNNFGDDLFGLACINGLNSFCDQHIPIILSPPVGRGGANYLVPKTLGRLYKNEGVIGKALRAVFMIYGCLRYKDVVLSGGSVISSGGSHRIRRIQYFFTKIGFCRLSAIGVSIGPFSCENDKAEAKLFINSLSYLTVRDEASVKECKLLGITVEPRLYNDLAGCVSLPIVSGFKIKNKTLGVSICRYESIVGADPERERLRNMSIFEGIADFAVKNGFKVKILILNANKTVGDADISKSFFAYLVANEVSAEVIDYVDPVESLTVISECDLFFSVRLHGAISAYLLDVPFLLVEYHVKCKDFLDYIGFDKKNRIAADVIEKRHVTNCLEAILQEGKKHSIEPPEYMEKSNEMFTESPWVK